ncbi:uncharacterized protein [Diabrotica undecimpunctata]|uniref:uncharacterized protein n=1 Tax=Diabrotica undecimpunctata TaxID=50387 RepID=UPI003B63767C
MNRFTVCRDMFVKTLGISTKRVNTALKKSRVLDLKDNRGKHQHHKRLSEMKKEEVKAHINKIPRYKSHYRRTQTDREYLPTDMTLEKMYNLYKSENNSPVSFSYYRRIFYTEFNITRKPLKKDTCNKCDTFSAKSAASNIVSDVENFNQQHYEHLEAAEKARKQMKEDFNEAKSNQLVETITFDLEKTLPMPKIPTNIIFYKRQIWLYNLGIHTATTNKVHCFIWPEGVAGRGSQEVGSCLKKFIDLYLGPEIKEIRFWCDSCGGQNRNIKICLLLKHALHNHRTLNKITINFLESGHSFLPNDADFSDIEKAIKFQQRLYGPEDYANVMRSCRKKNAITVNTMTTNDFLSSSTLEKMIVNRKTDIIGQKVNWLLVRKIKIEKERPFSLFFKFSHNDDEQFTEVDLKPKVKGKPQLSLTTDLELSWPTGKPMSTPKLNDIKSIMHLIPENEQNFFTSLLANDAIIDDVDGYDGDVDFEFETESE